MVWRVRALSRGLLAVGCVQGGRRLGCTQGNSDEGCHCREWDMLGEWLALVSPFLTCRPAEVTVVGRDAEA